MKAPLTPPAPPTKLPDFAGRPSRVSLDQLTAVPSYGKLKIRPIRLDDEEAMQRFHTGLSEESIYLRYFEYLGVDQRTGHKRLARICANSPDSYAVVIEHPAKPHRGAAILGVGRLTKAPEPFSCNFDTLVADGEQEDRLRKVLLARLIKLARAFGFKVLGGELLVADHDALNLCREFGFNLETIPQDGVVRVVLDL